MIAARAKSPEKAARLCKTLCKVWIRYARNMQKSIDMRTAPAHTPDRDNSSLRGLLGPQRGRVFTAGSPAWICLSVLSSFHSDPPSPDGGSFSFGHAV